MWSARYHVTEETSRFILSTGSALQLLLMVVTGWLARRERHLIDLSHFFGPVANGEWRRALQCSFEATP